MGMHKNSEMRRRLHEISLVSPILMRNGLLVAIMVQYTKLQTDGIIYENEQRKLNFLARNIVFC